MKVAVFFFAAISTATLFACKVQHDGSFEHDAGFVSASASVGVQIGHPPPSIATTPSASASASNAPVGPPPR